MHVECTKRERRMSILLSDDEQQIVDRYLEKYNEQVTLASRDDSHVYSQEYGRRLSDPFWRT